MGIRDKKKRREERVVSAKKRAAAGAGGGGRLAVRVPADMPQLVVGKEARTLTLDVVVFRAGKGNPFADPGSLYYERTYYTHQAVGPNNDTVICNAKTFNTKCPVCEYRAKLYQDPDLRNDPVKDALAKKLYPKQRQLWLVVDLDEPKKGLQLWEYSYHLFGKNLDNKINTAKERDRKQREEFADPKRGCTLELTGLKKSTGEGGGQFVEFADIQFVPRKKPIDPTILKAAPCLDDMVKPADYDEVKAAFFQTVQGEDDDTKEDEDDDDLDEDADEQDDEDDDRDDGDEDADDDESEDDGEDADADGDDDADEDEDQDEDDDDVDDEPICKVGDRVRCEYRDKIRKGRVVEINKADGIVRVRVPDKEQPLNLAYDQILAVIGGEPERPGKATKKPKKKRRDF